MSDVFAPQPVKTLTAGDVVVNINAGQSVGLATGTNVAGKFGIDQSVLGTSNGVQVVAALPTGANVVGKFAVDQSVAGTSNGVQVIAALPAGANVVGKFAVDQSVAGTSNGVQVVAALPAGSNIVGKFSIDQSVVGTTNGVQLTAGTAVFGSLVANQSVNTTQLGGNAIATAGGVTGAGVLRVVIVTDQTTIPVNFTPAGTSYDSGLLTSTALAAGATATLDGPTIAAASTGKLVEGTVSSSVAIKAVLGTWNGTAFVAKRTFFIPANATFAYEPSRNDLLTMAGGTTANFRWSITNNDNVLAANVYASLSYVV